MLSRHRGQRVGAEHLGANPTGKAGKLIDRQTANRDPRARVAKSLTQPVDRLAQTPQMLRQGG